jgi:hypothetical protein
MRTYAPYTGFIEWEQRYCIYVIEIENKKIQCSGNERKKNRNITAEK